MINTHVPKIHANVPDIHPAGPRRRIAIVTQGLDRGGGVSTVARWLRDGLAGAGHSVDLHDLAESRRDPYSRRITMPTSWRRSLKGPEAGATGVQYWGAAGVEIEPCRYLQRTELTRAMREYDLIQVVSGGAALACAVTGLGPPTFLQVATRAVWERQGKPGKLSLPRRVWSGAMTACVDRLERRALIQADGVLVENAEMLRFARRLGQYRALLAPPGVDTDRFSPRTIWNPDGYLLSVCRLNEPRKRLDRLIEAYQLLIQNDPRTPDLVLAGRGSLSKARLAQIHSLGLSDRVAIRSDVPEEDLPELLRGASVFLQTSAEEGLGLSVLQAMAAGLPVVATRTAGAKECVDDSVTGILVDQTHESRIAPSVAGHVRDIRAGVGLLMSTNARSRCLENFATKRTLAAFLTMYDTR